MVPKRPPTVELRHLRYAVVLADELHFGRAAAALAVTQSTVSQQIAALEDELGVVLFARTTRGTALTGAGRAFVRHARRALEEVERAVQLARSTAAGDVDASR